MDTRALAQLKAIGNGLVGDDGETVASIQAKREEEEVRREAILVPLRERLTSALRTISRSGGILDGEHEARGLAAERLQDERIREFYEAKRILLGRLEESSDPEAFTCEIEAQAKKAHEEVEALRKRRSNKR